jgi:teichuronic acid exporter
MNLRTKVISAVKWSILNRVIAQVVTWSATIIVIRLLAPEDYALIAISGLVIGFSQLLRDLGLGAAIIQRDDIDDEKMRIIFGVIIVTHIIMFLIINMLAPFAAAYFNQEKLTDILHVVSFQVLIPTLTMIPSALMVRAMQFKLQSIIGMIAAIFASLSTLVMAYLGYGVWSLVMGQFASILVSLVGYSLVAPYFKKPSFKFNKIRPYMSYSGQVFLADILYYFYTRADVVIVGKLLGPSTLGFYTVADNLAMLPMNKISGMLSGIGFAAYAQIKNNISEVKSKFLLTIEMNSLLFFPVLWGMSSIADDFIPVFLGDKWLPAIIVLQLIPLIIPFKMTGPLFRPALLGIGRADLFLTTLIINAICVPSAIAIGGFLGGLEGVCLGWIVGFSLAYFLNIRCFLPVLKTTLAEYAKMILPAMFMALAMYFVVAVAKMTILHDIDSVYRLWLSVAIGIAVYTSLIAIFKHHSFMLMISLARR